jgi:hypothetical protein
MGGFEMRGSLRRLGRLLGALAIALPIIEVAGLGPAAATAPTVGGFLPLTGAPGTSVTIAGSGFDDGSIATGVSFNGTAALFAVDSDAQITATVPVGATTGPITVTDGEGSNDSLLSFTVTAPPAPVVTGFDPVSGPVGTDVTIAGSGFTGATAVAFAGTGAPFSVDSDLQITATVPIGATDGPITVTTPGGSDQSAVDFTVESSVKHARSVSLRLRDRRASGRVSPEDGFGDCRSRVPVSIQRRQGSDWQVVKHVRTTNAGRYRALMPSRVRTIRAVAERRVISSGLHICQRSVSPTRALGRR